MDLFEKKEISPMLIAEEKEPFDSDDYIYELKLDGELYVFHNGRPDFFRVQKRTVVKNPFKIKLLSQNDPAIFTAFDILYVDGEDLQRRPLMERKKLLRSIIKENQQITVSRTIEREGIALFELTKERNLEGIVAKRKESLYFQGKRSKDWIKCKHMLEDDFIILGFKFLQDKTTSFLLGKMDKDQIIPVSAVSLGASYKKIKDQCRITGETKDGYTLIKPSIVCTVKFMGYTEEGQMRQPSLKCIRDDKRPDECEF